MSGSRVPAILITCFAAFGGFLYGFVSIWRKRDCHGTNSNQDTGLISGLLAMPFFRQTFGHPTTIVQDDGFPYVLSTSTKSLFTSILSAGTFTGALLGAPISDKFGRKLGLQLGCIVFAIGVACQTAATADGLFVVGRVLAGVGVGIISCIVP